MTHSPLFSNLEPLTWVGGAGVGVVTLTVRRRAVDKNEKKQTEEEDLAESPLFVHKNRNYPVFIFQWRVVWVSHTLAFGFVIPTK